RFFASAFGTFQLLDGVNLRVNFGPDYTHQSTGHYEGPDANFPGHTDREASYNQFANLQYTLDAMLQVNRDIGTVHHVDATLLYGHKWVTFPTVGLAWQLGDEPFMRRFASLNALKLRGSYGVTGNSSIDAYQTEGALLRTPYNFGSTTAPGYAPNPNNPANPN